MTSPDAHALAPHLAGAIARAGVDPTLEGRALQDALRSAIATRRGSCSWDVDHASWVAFLHAPEEQTFSGRTLEEALAWCLVWLLAPELGVGPFVVPRAQVEAATAWVPIPQPFAVGDRVIVVTNEHYERETLNLVGATGRVCQVYPYPIDRVMDCGVMLDGESEPRSFPPSVFARLDPEADDGD